MKNINKRQMYKGMDDVVADMTRSFLLDPEIMTEKTKAQIIKALKINAHLTSCWMLQVTEVQDIKGTDANTSGFYFILSGTRCGVKFFINNNMEIVRKPNKNKCEVKHVYGLHNHKYFDECFWSENF